jgi:hypothetical protein
MRPLALVPPLLAAITLSAALPGAAQNAFTVYGGYRGGGNFEAGTSPYDSLSLKSSAAASVSVDWAIDPARQVQVFASYQSTDIESSPSTPQLPLTLAYLHLGGTNFFEGNIGRGPYVVGGLGVTRLARGLDGLSAEYRPSMNLGLGYQLPLSAALSLRLELRGYFTLVNSDGSLFCSGGCVVQIKGDGLTQAEALVGLSFGF